MEGTRYTVIYEAGPTSFGAYAPDLPGCVAAAATLDEVKVLMREAVADHVAALRRRGLPVPEPTVIAEFVEVA